MTTIGHVLVIDDSSTLRKLVEIAFRGTATKVEFADSGLAGVERAVADPPDVILLDYVLPDMRGVEVCRRLMRHGPTARVPVVVMSGNKDGITDLFRDLPQVVDFVPKPFTTDEIGRRLRAAMRSAGSANPLDARPRLRRADDVVRSGGPTPSLTLAVELGLLGLADVLRLVQAAGADGHLRLTNQDAAFEVQCVGGEVMACTTAGSDDDLVDHAELHGLSEDDLTRARDEQQRTGKPILVTLAESGMLRSSDVPALLRAGTKRAMGRALNLRSGRATWHPAPPPRWVEIFGRSISVASLALAHARRHQTPQPAATSAFLDETFERTPHFSRGISGAHLSAKERAALALIDGVLTTRTILDRIAVPADRGAALLSRLRGAGLIQPCERTTGLDLVDFAPGAVAVLDPDREGFIAPLRSHLRRRPQPIETIDLGDADLELTVRELRPQLVLIAEASVDARQIAARLAPISRAGATALVAVLDAAGSVDELMAWGYDAVLIKPVHFNEIERLLSY